MGFRFRKSIKIAPGIRVNFGKRGASLTVGARGATMTFSSSGTFANVGIPGTGLSYRARVDRGSAGGSAPRVTVAEQGRLLRQQERHAREVARIEEERRRAEALEKVSLKLQDDGSFTAFNAFGAPLSDADMRLLWDQQGPVVTAWLQERANEINGDAELLSRIHLDTPVSDTEPAYTKVPFDRPEPQRPQLPEISPKPVKGPAPAPNFLERHLDSRAEEYQRTVEAHEKDYHRRYHAWLASEKTKAATYQDRLARWERDHAEWQAAAASHEQREDELEGTFPERLRSDLDLMDSLLDAAMNGLDWPRETIVSYQIDGCGQLIWLDVDLPEIEHLPQRVAAVASNGRKLNIKTKPKTQLLQEYAAHIHGIALRLAGTVFATLPAADVAVISGYSQRLHPETGHVEDDYLFSVRFERERFSRINFETLEQVDPVEAIAAFEHRRSMTKTGVLKPITPFSFSFSFSIADD